MVKDPLLNDPVFNAPSNYAATVASEAAQAVLSLPEAAENTAIPRLLEFLSFDEPVVDRLPFLFLDESEKTKDAAFLHRVRGISVAGRLLCGRVRWLDDMADSGEVAGSFEDIHSLSTAVHAEAASRFCSALSDAADTVGFFASLAESNARYATSVALDCAAIRIMPKNVSLTSYIEQAKARAVIVRAPVDALMLLLGAGSEETRLARRCFETLAAAMQFADDILDLEEDYEQNTLTWLVSDTLSKNPDPPPSPDRFYESALLEGSMEAAFKEALRLYGEVARMAQGRFVGIEKFARSEISRLRDWQGDIAHMVAEVESRDRGRGRRHEVG